MMAPLSPMQTSFLPVAPACGAAVCALADPYHLTDPYQYCSRCAQMWDQQVHCGS